MCAKLSFQNITEEGQIVWPLKYSLLLVMGQSTKMITRQIQL